MDMLFCWYYGTGQAPNPPQTTYVLESRCHSIPKVVKVETSNMCATISFEGDKCQVFVRAKLGNRTSDKSKKCTYQKVTQDWAVPNYINTSRDCNE